MARDITVAAENRTSRGKNEARRLRTKGLIPAIVYGAFQEPLAVAVNPKQVERIMHSKKGHNTIFDVVVKDGETTPAMVVDFQYDPLKDTLLHVDLKRIDLTKRLTVAVPVITTGEPVGVKIQGGLLEIVTREITIECLPDDIPEHYTVDVSQLSIGDSIRAGDIKLAEGAELVSSADIVIAHCVAIKEEEVVTPAEGATPEAAAGSEPEVIKKGKKEEEAAADDKAKKK